VNRALLAAVALAVAGCAGSPLRAGSTPSSPTTSTAAIASPAEPEPEPPFADPPSPLEGFLRPGASRPPSRSIRFDVDALPVATWGAPLPDAGFVLHAIPDGWSVFVRTTLYAEVVVAASASYEEHGTSRVGFSAYTASSFAAGDVPPCGKGHTGRRLAVWGGMAPAGWTDEGVDVEMDQGDYDLSTCQALPKRSLRGRARAVVRGFVYALRLREEPEDDRPGPESLLVLLPRAAMVSASADPDRPIQTTNTGTFTRLTFPLTVGEAGTASVRVSAPALQLWGALRAGRRMPMIEGTKLDEDLVVGVDVTSDVDRRSGSISFALPRSADRRPFQRLLAAAHVTLPD
jgi:hypothetical protein